MIPQTKNAYRNDRLLQVKFKTVLRECRCSHGRIVSMGFQKLAHFMRWRHKCRSAAAWCRKRLQCLVLVFGSCQGIGEALRYIHSLQVVHSNATSLDGNSGLTKEWPGVLAVFQGEPWEHFHQDWRRVSAWILSAIKLVLGCLSQRVFTLPFAQTRRISATRFTW